MRTAETDAKAEAVRSHLVGKSVVVLEHHFTDQRASPDDARATVQRRQREWYYRYLLQDKAGATEIRVTLEAMRDGDVETLARLVLSARRRKALGEPGAVWLDMIDGQPTVSVEAAWSS